ncbi:hypothetical protein WA026_018564 [Henosepilachna vigintioctopunctata]|uniref:Uncharacterized protein n=1 Tax=Henosepilachna vigintioctopunctata TaxID=420089 RepID=A0AAW1U8N8_9CUCU
MKILESDKTDVKNNITYQYPLRSSNLPMYKSLPTVEKMKNSSKYSLESIDSRSRSKDDIKINSRRILSSTMNNEESAQFHNIENTTFSFNNHYFKFQTQKKSVNSTHGFFGSNGGRQSDIEYEDVPISEMPIKDSSTNEVHLKTIKNRRIDPTLIKELPNLTEDSMNNFTSNLSEESELIGDKVDKNNLYVPNEDYLPSEWKRRKRDIRLDSKYRDNARKKRLNWFWPIKSSYGQNTPQNEEYDQFDPNEASDSGKENSERFKDNSAGVDNNYEDFSVDVEDYDRKKRQLNSFAPVFSGGNQKTYGYAGSQRLHYLPESRARRYVDGWYREPHRELLTDMSDVELFGALPQSYAGELNRYKRVKRGKWGRY